MWFEDDFRFYGISMKIVRTVPGHEEILANYFVVNEDHFRPWSPGVPEGHHSVESWRRRLEEREIEFENRQSVHFIATDDTASYVIGSCSLTQILFGIVKSANLGYSIAARYEGQGRAKQLVQHVINYGFNELNLHRIEASYMPANERSAGLLMSLGFEREGYARDYLFINGNWEDHILNAIINPN